MKIDIQSKLNTSLFAISDHKDQVLTYFADEKYIIDEKSDEVIGDSYTIYFECLDIVLLFDDEDMLVYVEFFSNSQEKCQLSIDGIRLSFKESPITIFKQQGLDIFYNGDITYFLPKYNVMMTIEDDILGSFMLANTEYYEAYFEANYPEPI